MIEVLQLVFMSKKSSAVIYMYEKRKRCTASRNQNSMPKAVCRKHFFPQQGTHFEASMKLE